MRPFFPTHTGHWAHTRSVGGGGLPRSNHRRAAPALHMAWQHTQSPATIGAPIKSDEQAITATHRHPPAR